MADKKYLDKGGVEHLWTKVKSWISSNYAVKSHNHNITSLTGWNTYFKTSINGVSFGYGNIRLKMESNGISEGVSFVMTNDGDTFGDPTESIISFDEDQSGLRNIIVGINAGYHSINGMKIVHAYKQNTDFTCQVNSSFGKKVDFLIIYPSSTSNGSSLATKFYRVSPGEKSASINIAKNSFVVVFYASVNA